MSSYLDGLNPQQKEAVLATDGPMMILAGAGSGKTKTLISKVIHLLKTKDVQPWEILAVTFSNRAANEMKERIHKSLPEIASSSLQISTFHAFCARVLRMQCTAIGLKSSFSIYDDSESTAVAKAILKRHDIDPKQISPSGLCHFIDQMKNQGYYLNRPNFKLRKDIPLDKHWPYFEEFEKELANNNAVDFGSLITKCLELFENHPQILDYYTRKYKYILVDEYQDTNKAQFDLIKLLASKHQNLCVVGDSDQCLIEGTLISTPGGLKPIETIKEGETIYGARSKTGPNPWNNILNQLKDKEGPVVLTEEDFPEKKYGFKGLVKVNKVHKKQVQEELIVITTNQGKILKSTRSHIHLVKGVSLKGNRLILNDNSETQKPHSLYIDDKVGLDARVAVMHSYWQEHKGQELLPEQMIVDNYYCDFIPASRLSVGDQLVNEAGQLETITELHKEFFDGYVYDLDIDTYHNYIASGLFTHNSIYSWRGAEIRNILDFEKVYPQAKILKLEENYRSSKNIIEAATEMIKKNMYRKEKNMFTQNQQGEKIKIYECLDGLRESQFVAQSINNLLKQKESPKEIAIFYRTNAQSRGLEDSLRRLMIPYQIIGGLKFYERKEVKDVVAYLQVMMNPFDEISLLRVINTPSRGIGDKTISSLIENSRSAGLNLFDYLKLTLQKNPKSLGGNKAIQGISKFVEVISKGQQMNLNGDSPSDIFEHIMDETGYIEILKASNKYEDQARIENLQELKSSIIQFLATSEEKTLTAYLETITLDRTEDNLDYGKVSLMTIHASKGLEFDHVFIVGLEEGMFPSGQSLGEGIERLEEERRLFYVSVTRARKNLHIFYAKSRLLYGKLVNNPVSRFIGELPKNYIAKFRV